MLMRIGLLFSLTWIIGLTAPLLGSGAMSYPGVI
jgi:predicted tellurium resistance membrane protein TerC